MHSRISQSTSRSRLCRYSYEECGVSTQVLSKCLNNSRCAGQPSSAVTRCLCTLLAAVPLHGPSPKQALWRTHPGVVVVDRAPGHTHCHSVHLLVQHSPIWIWLPSLLCSTQATVHGHCCALGRSNAHLGALPHFPLPQIAQSQRQMTPTCIA